MALQTTDSQTPNSDDLRFNTAPNFLTLIRMLCVPLVVGALYLKTPGWDLAAALIFGAASITDYFDGYLARSQKTVTLYGKLMDPLADKFLVVSSLVMLLELGRVPAWVVILLICRELGITALRALASAEGVIIDASRSAKWKTATQMVAIPFLMVVQGLWGLPLFQVGQALLYFSLLISLWSAVAYVYDFFIGVQQKRAERKASRLQNAR